MSGQRLHENFRIRNGVVVFLFFFLNWNNAFGTNRLRHEKVTCAYPYHTTHSTPLPGHTLLSHTPEYMHYENMPIQIY